MGEYTQAAYNRIVARLSDCEAELAKAMLRLGEAAGDGNNTWHDNPAFDEANEAIRRWRREVSVLKEMVADATIVTASTDGTVDIGCDVVYRLEDGTDEHKVHIAGVTAIRSENDEIRMLSTSAPLGKALLGRSAGETVSYTAPTGRVITVVILAVT